MKKKLLITGASGFLGYHLMRVAAPFFEVFGVYRTKDFDFAAATHVACDILNYIELGNYFDEIEPDAVIHAAAISDANFCEQNKKLSFEVNVEASKNIAGICCDFKIPLAFISTDLVFDGKKGMYKEEDKKNPLSAYGEQKSIAEEEVMKIFPGAVIFRLPLMFGYPEASSSNYIQKFMTQIKRAEKVKLFTDEYRSVCGAKSISQGIFKLLFPGNSQADRSGHTIIHIAGREKLSRYDFGTRVVQAYGIDPSLLQSCSQKDVKMAAPRPSDVSLDISKSLALGYSPLSVEEELKIIFDNKYF